MEEERIDIDTEAEQEESLLEPSEATNPAEEEEEVSRPLSYYKELGIKPPALNETPLPAAEIKAEMRIPVASPAQDANSEDGQDNDTPSRPLSYYRELKAQQDAEAREQRRSKLLAQNSTEAEAEAAEENETVKPQRQKQPLFPVKGDPFGIQGIAETAVLAAIAVILGYFGYMLPVFSFIAPLFFPLPMAILTLRRGLPSGICGTLISGLILAFLLNPVSALLLIIQSGLVGLFFGYCHRKSKKPFFTLFGGTVIASVGFAAAMVLSALLAGVGIPSLLAELDEIAVLYQQMLENIGYYETLAAQGIDPEIYIAQLMSMVKSLLPAMLIISNMLITIASYWLFGKILKPLGYSRSPLPPFSQWRMSIHLIWGLIIGGFFAFFGYTKDLGILYNIGTNILYIFSPLLMITAMSVMVGIGRAHKWSAITYTLIIFALFMLLPYSLAVLLLIGMFDPIIDFRRRFGKQAVKGS